MNLEWSRIGRGMVEDWSRNGRGMVEEWSRNGRGMVEPWWSTSEVVRDIGAIMERLPTFSHEVKVVVLGSFKMHFEVGMVEEWSRNGRGMVEQVHLALAVRGGA